MPKLEDWSIVRDDSNPFLAPELRGLRLQGRVYGRDDFEDGSVVTTSSVQSLDLKNNIAKTRNTEYILGKPSKDYVRWLNDNGKKLEDYI
jgi:hypothetical protein